MRHCPTLAGEGQTLVLSKRLLVRYVIDGDYILQDFGDDEVSYLSKDQFDKLAAGEQEAAQGVNLNAWCVVKLE